MILPYLPYTFTSESLNKKVSSRFQVSFILSPLGENILGTHSSVIERIVNDVEQMIKEDQRQNSEDLKYTIRDIEERMELLKDKLEKSMNELEEKIEKRIKLALENPLSQLNG